MRALLLLSLLLASTDSSAFCGFYVAKADSQLYNQASRVVLARSGDTSVVTMANDYRGEPSEFAMIVPVPTVIGPGDVKVLDAALIDRIDDFTAPRLVEYFEEAPCGMPDFSKILGGGGGGEPTSKPSKLRADEPEDLGVTVEASYTVEEYEVLLLSAEQSDGLQQWLNNEGYSVPAEAIPVLGSYIRQGLRFFVARVSLDHRDASGRTELRPLQVRFESPRFGLPIRLGTVNADGAQDLLLYVLSDRGRVETTNYRTARIPTDKAVPEIAQYEFGDFYRAMFSETVRKNPDAVVLEYSWPLSTKCDPCTTSVITQAEKELLGSKSANHVTRLHVRYDAASFPEDLKLQETGDHSTFQGRYPVTHPYKGPAECPDGRAYHETVRARQQGEVQNLADLTGWEEDAIWSRMDWVPPTRRRRGGGGPLPWQIWDTPLP